MKNGKYILISMKEFKGKISDYLKINFNIVTENTTNGSALLQLYREDIERVNDFKVFSKICGENASLAVKILSENTYIKDICFSMEECSYMLKNIFNINENVTFEADTTLNNKNENIYLFYS